ncbi:MAG: carboxypeptidase regulatory-like domain-containing protein [Thermoplasmata archaeon]|nr:carboxypeptidase regulatory-like domain-containing protein [Thermoplasmata archaeon]
MKEKASLMRFALFAVVGLLVLGAIVPLLSSGQGVPEGTVVVIVYDAENQSPIVNATVFLDYTNEFWKTDKNGIAVIENVPLGNHTLTVYKEGYQTKIQSFVLKDNATKVAVRLSPLPTTTVGYIKGQVFLEQLIPGHTAGEAIIGFESPVHVPTGEIIDVMETSNPQVGEYIVEVPAGTYHLWCWAYSHHVKHSSAITVEAGSVTYYDFYLNYVDMSNSGLAGNITDADNEEPINNAVVIAYNEDTGEILYTLSDSDGFYFFTGPWAGDYTVVAMAPGYNPGSGTGTVTWGHVTYVDIALKPNGTGQDVCSALWGFVFGDGSPLTNAWVFADYGAMVTTNLFGVPGLYYIPCFPTDGPHHAGAWAPGYYPVFDTVTVPPASIIRHDFYLQSGGDYNGKESLILGEVLYTGTTNPVNGATVHLDSSSTGFSGTYTCSSTSNLFYFTLVSPGPDYLVSAVKSGYTYTGFTVDSGTMNSPGTSFTIPSASIVHLDLYMTRGNENKTCLWGYVYYFSLGGSVAPGIPIKILTPFPGPMDTTNAVGMYYFSVTPGTYSETPLVTYPGGVISYDHATSSYGPAVWSGTITPGECRRVDFILKYQYDPDRKFGSIYGQVIDLSSGNPVDNFEVKVYHTTPLTTLSGGTAPGTGLFQFTGLTPTSVTWTLDGYDTTYTYTVDHIDYYVPATSTTPSTSSGLPVTFTLPAAPTWFYIYVNKTEVINKTVIWGYIYDSYSNPIPGTPFFIHPDSLGGDFTYADTSGKYVFYVDPGSYLVTPIIIGTGTVVYYDYGTSSSGMAPWTGSVSAGEIRQVDFMIKGYKPPEKCSAIAGIAYLNPSTPLGGVHVQASSVSDSSYTFWDFTDSYGLFNFHPLCRHLNEDWEFIPHTPHYTLDRMEYHLLGSSTVMTSYGTSITFNLPSASIMWVEVYFNRTNICNGTVFGKIYKLYSYAPAVGASVSIYSTADPTTPVDTTTTGPDGLYTFTVPAGTYIIKVNLAGYYPASATVDISCDEEVYKPFYLVPRIEPIPLDPICIKVVYSGNNTPIMGATVIIDGVGKGTTNESGGIQFKLYSEGNYSIKVLHDAAMRPITNMRGATTILDAFIVFVSTESDKEDEEEEFVLDPNPDGTYHLKPGMHYKIVVLPTGAQEKPQEKEEKKGEYSTAAVAGVAVAALVVGGVAGFLLRGRPGEGYMGE